MVLTVTVVSQWAIYTMSNAYICRPLLHISGQRAIHRALHYKKKTEVHLQYALLVSQISLVYKHVSKYAVSLLRAEHHQCSALYSERL